MAVHAGEEQTICEIPLIGLSLAGIRTSIAVPGQSICFDVAQGFPFMFNINNFFISHGHLDHAAGIPYIISQKAMHDLAAPKFYMPESLVSPLLEIMKTWQHIEKHDYDFQFIAAQPGAEIGINQHYFIKSFKTIHRIDSLGYTLFQRKKKLKSEFLNLRPDQIQKIKKSGQEVDDLLEIPLLSFTGDTQIDFLDDCPTWVTKSKVLLLESTYLDQRKTIEQARKWGHTHLDEILLRLPQLECEKIVLIHISSRYSRKEIHEILERKIPSEYKSKIMTLTGR